MGVVNNIPIRAAERLASRLSWAAAENIHVVDKPHLPDFGPHDIEVQVCMGALNYVAQAVFSGRLKIAVWVKHNKDRVGDTDAALTNTTDGLGILAEDIRNVMNGTYLSGTLLSPLTVDTAFSAPEANDDVVMCWQDYTFDVLTAMPTAALDSQGTDPDIGEPEA